MAKDFSTLKRGIFRKLSNQNHHRIIDCSITTRSTPVVQTGKCDNETIQSTYSTKNTSYIYPFKLECERQLKLQRSRLHILS